MRGAARTVIMSPFSRATSSLMDTRIIDGAALSRTIRSELHGRIMALRSAGVTPGLAVVFVGDDPASRIYVRNKGRACTEVALHSEQHDLPASATEAQVLERVRVLNGDRRIHGILVQLPLPAHVSGERVLRAIEPAKDVDGFHPFNVGLLATGHPAFVPCTPAGVMRMLDREGIDTEGRHAVIDVGINRLPDGQGKLAGDVDFQGLLGRASHLTPVPGGVGPMTIAMLLENTVCAAERTVKNA